MTRFDKTYCASPNCENGCGRRPPESLSLEIGDDCFSYGYFCGEPEEIREHIMGIINDKHD